MNLIPSTTELSPGSCSKGGCIKRCSKLLRSPSSCENLQGLEHHNPWDLVLCLTNLHSLSLILSLHTTDMNSTISSPQPTPGGRGSDTPSCLFQEPHFLTSHTKSSSSPAVSATLPDWTLQTQDMPLQTPSRQHWAENNRPSLPVSCAVAHAAQPSQLHCPGFTDSCPGALLQTACVPLPAYTQHRWVQREGPCWATHTPAVTAATKGMQDRDLKPYTGNKLEP